MIKIALTFLIFVTVFPQNSEAFLCPESLKVEITGMDFASPGDSYTYFNGLGNNASSFATLKRDFRTEIEAHVIDLGAVIVRKPLTLVRTKNKLFKPEEYDGINGSEPNPKILCEYQVIENVHMVAAIESYSQDAWTGYKGVPQVGETSFRLRIRQPINLASFSRKYHKKAEVYSRLLDFYIWGSVVYGIWLDRNKDGEFKAGNFEDVSAMLLFELERTKFDFPLGVSRPEEVKVSILEAGRGDAVSLVQ